jgi:hypothetical protein
MRTALTTLAASLALLAPTAASGGTSASPRVPILGVVPHAGTPTALGAVAAAGADDLSLQESPCALSSSPYPCWTMRTNTTYAIYWIPSGYSVDANYESVINRFLGDVAAASGGQTNVYSVATQYYDNAAAIHYQSAFAGAYVDTDPFPSSGCSDGSSTDRVCLTDDQIQAEIQKVLTARGWHGGRTTVFFVMTPDGVGSCFDNVTDQCTTTAYCAYHSGFFDANNEPVIYANEPYDATIPGCWDGTSPNGDDADATVNTLSHEQNEAITDPAGDAWINAGGQEIGDICAWHYGTALGGSLGTDAYNQVINNDHYWLQEEYSNEGSTCLQRYTPTMAPDTVAAPLLTGAAGQGQILATSEGSWMHAPSSYAYQWQRCAANGGGCADISSATAATYRLTAADVGHTVRADVEAQNAAGTSTFAASPPSAVVVPTPSATTQPVLSGVAGVGRELFTTTGAWNTTVTVAYQWFRCAADGTACVPIRTATAAIYILRAADAGHTLEARVSATNAAATTVVVSTRSIVVVAAAVPVATRAPHVSGRARVGRRLSTGRGTWTGPPTSYRYQWLRCNRGTCVRIARATHSTYLVTKHDAGSRLRARVTAVDVAGSATATSSASARVPATRKR